MALIEQVMDAFGMGPTEPKTYRCENCDRTFEVNTPPERVICGDCGNKDVELLAE